MQPLYPIPTISTDTDFEMLAGFDERNLNFLKEDYLRLSNNKIIPPLLRLESRAEVADRATQRRPYRAGVIAGSIILRARLHGIDVSPRAVFDQEVVGDVDWRGMRSARFALRQYFAEGVDVKHHLYQSVELPWALQNSSFVDPDARQHELREDWMVIGLGDTLRLGEIAYAKHLGIAPREPLVLNIIDGTIPKGA